MMAAEALANELKLDLFKVDLSAIVRKHIGEIEKVLQRLFDECEADGAILFYDEADSLFGERTEVRDSHDRYSNIQIDYILKRIEAYRGLAILSTNMKNSIDSAFTRRIRFVVTFSNS
jgi:SpoVK/Ycf46/Vps4 family AAA+-type ATPase